MLCPGCLQRPELQTLPSGHFPKEPKKKTFSLLQLPGEAYHSGFNGRKFYCYFWATKSCPTLCDPMDCSTRGFPVLHYLPEFAQIHNHCVGDANQLSHPLLPPSPPALNLPQHQVFSNELALYIRWPKYRASLIAQMVKNVPAMRETRVWSLGREDPWRREWQPTPAFLPGEFYGQKSNWLARVHVVPKIRHDWATNVYWSFSFSVSPSKNIQVWFRDRFHLLADQRTLKSLLRQHNLKVKFYCAQLSLWSNSHKIIGNTIALTIQSFVLKVMPMLFKMLSSSVIAFLPRSKCLSIL